MSAKIRGKEGTSGCYIHDGTKRLAVVPICRLLMFLFNIQNVFKDRRLLQGDTKRIRKHYSSYTRRRATHDDNNCSWYSGALAFDYGVTLVLPTANDPGVGRCWPYDGPPCCLRAFLSCNLHPCSLEWQMPLRCSRIKNRHDRDMDEI